MADQLTTREVADALGTVEWRVRRLFETGTLPEPQRFAGKRAIPRERIAEIAQALRDRGWLPDAAPVPVTTKPAPAGRRQRGRKRQPAT